MVKQNSEKSRALTWDSTVIAWFQLFERKIYERMVFKLENGPQKLCMPSYIYGIMKLQGELG